MVVFVFIRTQIKRRLFNMKKLIALLLALTLMVAIVGCEKKPAAMTHEQYVAAANDSEVIVEAYVAAIES
jgi:curli biogenesis system outer membrane secretion channel CsgG